MPVSNPFGEFSLGQNQIVLKVGSSFYTPAVSTEWMLRILVSFVSRSLYETREKHHHEHHVRKKDRKVPHPNQYAPTCIYST